jgi:Neutral/alkaline non-lysosomal ceramidase, N-terminal
VTPRAGFGRAELSGSVLGSELVGYTNRDGGATGVHDQLLARAMVLEAGGDRVAVCGVDLCYVGEDVVASARERITARGLVAADAVFVSASHTHSGPHYADQRAFPDGLDVLIEAAVAQACEQLEPARVGAGFGMVHGVALNRRRLEDPVDPAVFVVRVDDLAGRPLGVYYGFGCHPVVMGPDNLLASGDWPGSCSRLVESLLGRDVVAVFGQGACADVNPLTPAVRVEMTRGPRLTSTAGFVYYGPSREISGAVWDRTGGTFTEADEFAAVVADEVVRVHRGVIVRGLERVWTRRLLIEQLAPEPPAGGGLEAEHPARVWDGGVRVPHDQPLEVMLVCIDGPDIVLAGQAGEVFADTGISLRRDLRNAGVAYPFVVGYANGWRLYLPPPHAFPDAGYEVGWAAALGIPATLQDDIRSRIRNVVA